MPYELGCFGSITLFLLQGCCGHPLFEIEEPLITFQLFFAADNEGGMCTVKFPLNLHFQFPDEGIVATALSRSLPKSELFPSTAVVAIR